MKKLLALVMAAVMLLTAGGAFAAANPIVYKVEAENGSMIYLLGTIHAVRNDLYDTEPPLGAALEEAYAYADTLAVEVDLLAELQASQGQDAEAQMLAMLDMMYTDGTSVLDRGMSEETLNAYAEMLGMPAEMLAGIKLYNWTALLMLPVLNELNMNMESGVDLWLLQRAYTDGKRVIELETIDEQNAALETASDELIIRQAQDLLDNFDENVEHMDQMYTAWAEGDAENLRIFMDESEKMAELGEELAADMEDYNASLGQERDDEFLNDAIAFLENGEKVLIAIGAMHILGETGIAERLADAGYTVTDISK